MKKLILCVAIVAFAGMFTSCHDKDDSNLLVGAWTSTDQSFDITIAGAQSIPAGAIVMEFTADSVLISDMRCNCVPSWHRYSLTMADGKQMLFVEGLYDEGFVVSELTSNKLSLTDNYQSFDMGYIYVMTRTTSKK